MDEYAGNEKDPKVLVIVHGKGAFGGLYGNVMQYALRSGLRVIVPDLPHYGMSGPGNLDKSPARTMQDMREVVHELVVNQLGVKKAAYLGHSLGGQLVMGYTFNGLEDLGRDVITPFMVRMTRAGNQPVLKLYPNTGHFIHADNPVEFPADVVDFVTTGNVDAYSPVAIDHLINGATGVAPPRRRSCRRKHLRRWA